MQAIHCVKSVRIRIIFWSVYNPNTGKYRPEKLRIRTLFRQWLYSISIKQMTLILNLLLVQRKSKMHHQLTYWASIYILIKFVWYLEINTIHLLGAIHAFLGYEERKILVNSFVLSYSKYCPLISLVANAKSEQKVEAISEKSLVCYEKWL